MLSLLRWSLGSGNDQLTEKASVKAVAKRSRSLAAAAGGPSAAAAAAVSSANMPATSQAKRKRADSALSQMSASAPVPVAASVSAQRPAKRSAVGHADVAGAKAVAAVTDAPPAAVQSVPTPPPSMDWESEKDKEKAHVDGALPEGGASLAAHAQVSAVPATPKVVDMDALQQAIESEFCLEILLKHRELRLIDQEIAKCQIALEQLRRCSIVPYPAVTSRAEDMLQVSSGSGPSLRAPPGTREAARPAPWGVTEGPYSRHYAHWLLPDPAFDGGVVADEPRVSTRGGKTLPDRHTRGSKGETLQTPKSRSQRGFAESRLHALPAGYPGPKEEKGPMIVKRASDNKFVKLVCLDCKRENFNSAQGFINHCRIAHGRGFASHEAAAQACGQEVEATEPSNGAAATVPQEALTSAGALPSTSTGLVHPLVRGSTTIPKLSMPTPRKAQAKDGQPAASGTVATAAAPAAVAPKPLAEQVSAHSTPASNPPPAAVQQSNLPFVPSPSTPHLSKLFARSGRGGDLNSIIADATVREDLDALADEEDGASGSDTDYEPVELSSFSHANARLPSRGGLRAGPTHISPAPGDSNRPHSRKGIERTTGWHSGGLTRTSLAQQIPGSTSASTPAFNRSHQHQHHHDYPTSFEMPSETLPHDLSPHTVESNNAPSLVSDSSDDDDDDDDDDDSEADEDYETGAGTSVPSSEVDVGAGDGRRRRRRSEGHHMEVMDVEIEDVVRERGGVGRHDHHHHHHHHHHHNDHHPRHHHDHEDDEMGDEAVAVVAGKSDDPELRASGKAKVKVHARRTLRGAGPKKR